MENTRMEKVTTASDSGRNEYREFILAAILLVLLFLTMI